MTKSLSHFDAHGRAAMVDVSAKPPTQRSAVVGAVLHLSAEAFEAIQAQRLVKGDAFTVAKIAGIQAAKRTAELIPLCHPLPIEHLDVRFTPEAATQTIRLEAQATTTAKTGATNTFQGTSKTGTKKTTREEACSQKNANENQ